MIFLVLSTFDNEIPSNGVWFRTFIPIPILGTLIGETIGVFVGDLLYELIMGKGIEGVGQKLKDTLMTLFKGGKMVADWVGGGIKAFVNNVLSTDTMDVKKGFGRGLGEK